MASSSVALVVRPRGKPIRQLPEETTVASGASAADLYHRLAAESGLSINRIRVTKGSDGSLVPNAKDVTLERTGLREQSTVYVKDLGPQIAWRTVFIVEYLGPLLIHPLFYLLRPYIYTNPNALAPFPPPSLSQTLALILITLHFVKRELETLFVHRFSLATMPARNILKNSAHYWIFAGANLAYWIYRPDVPTANPSTRLVAYVGLLLYVVGELGNLSAHLTLRGLRSTGGTERGIPHGFGFGLVTCPNYMFEAMAWVGIGLVTMSWSTLVFDVLAVGQMAVWARKREMKYRREFGDQYKRKRYTMLPGIW